MTATFHTVFGIQAAVITPLISDINGVLTYGDPIRVPGAKNLEITGTYSEKEIRGDNGPFDTFSNLDKVEGSVAMAGWQPELFAWVTGSTLIQGEDGSYRIEYPKTASARFFKLQAVSVTSDGQNTDIIMPKLKITSMPDIGFKEEDFKDVNLKWKAMPTSGSNGQWFDFGNNAEAITL